jgi:HEAT repeat protein
MRCSLNVAVALLLLGPALAAGAPDKKDPKDPKGESTSSKESSGPKEVSGKTLEQWIKDMKDADPSVRETAIQAVVHFGPAARKAVPELITELRDLDASIRTNAAISLGMIGMDEKDLKRGVAGLKLLLSDQQGVIRYQAAMALGRIGTDASEAASYLATYTVKDLSSWEIRKAAAYALGSVAGKEKDDPDVAAIKGLIYAAGNDSSAQVRLEAIMSLILLGPPKNDSVKDSEEQLFHKLMNHKNRVLVIWAHVGTMRINKVTKEHVEAIANQLASPDQMTRMHAVRALGSLGTEAKAAIPMLVQAMQTTDPTTRHLAAMALAAIADAKTAVPPLIDTLKDKESSVRLAAVQALGRLGPLAKPAVPGLIEVLQKDREAVVVGAAIWAVGEIGEGARDAIPALQKIIKEEDEPLPKAATEAINKIEGKKPKTTK